VANWNSAVERAWPGCKFEYAAAFVEPVGTERSDPRQRASSGDWIGYTADYSHPPTRLE
jgi:hypothetical protein